MENKICVRSTKQTVPEKESEIEKEREEREKIHIEEDREKITVDHKNSIDHKKRLPKKKMTPLENSEQNPVEFINHIFFNTFVRYPLLISLPFRCHIHHVH